MGEEADAGARICYNLLLSPAEEWPYPKSKLCKDGSIQMNRLKALLFIDSIGAGVAEVADARDLKSLAP